MTATALTRRASRINLAAMKPRTWACLGLTVLLAMSACNRRAPQVAPEVPTTSRVPSPYGVSGAVLPEFRAMAAALRPRSTLADQLDLQFSSEGQRLTAKFTQAIRSDPAWFQEYVRQNASGGPLPYSPKFGLSEEEYRQYLREMENVTSRRWRRFAW